MTSSIPKSGTGITFTASAIPTAHRNGLGSRSSVASAFVSFTVKRSWLRKPQPQTSATPPTAMRHHAHQGMGSRLRRSWRIPVGTRGSARREGRTSFFLALARIRAGARNGMDRAPRAVYGGSPAVCRHSVQAAGRPGTRRRRGELRLRPSPRQRGCLVAIAVRSPLTWLTTLVIVPILGSHLLFEHNRPMLIGGNPLWSLMAALATRLR